MKGIALLAGGSNVELACKIQSELNRINETHIRDLQVPEIKIIDAALRRFADGECYCAIQDTVRGSHLFIIQSVATPVNDNLMELLIMIDAARRASAGVITAVVPYLGYMRQDRKVARRDPISARLVANMIEAAGADRVLAMDLHANQIQGFFNIPVDNLSGAKVFSEYLTNNIDLSNAIAVSPDTGGTVRTRKFAARLGIDRIAIIDKVRERANQSEVMNVIGNVRGKDCIIFDDIIDTAGTLCNAAEALVTIGKAKSVIACASHGILSKDAVTKINNSYLRKVFLLDTISKDINLNNFQYLTCSKLIAEAIDNIYRDTSFDRSGL